MATLGETSQQIGILNTIINDGILPGSRGANIGSKRLSDEAMRTLSSHHHVEFAQVYFQGSRKNGGGGYYVLYSGTKNAVNVPKDQGAFLINHTHPAGNSSPSTWDVQYLENMKSAGSPQNSSVILPLGKPASRFNVNTPTIK